MPGLKFDPKHYHETLNAAIEWSHTELDERQRALLNDGDELINAYGEWFETGELPHRLTKEEPKEHWVKICNFTLGGKKAAPAATEKPAPAGTDLGNGFYLAYSNADETEPKTYENWVELATEWAYENLDDFWVRELEYSELVQIYKNWCETGEIPTEYAKQSHKRKSSYEFVQEELNKYFEEIEKEEELEAPPKKRAAPAANDDDSDDDVIEIPPPRKPTPEVIVIDDDSDDEMEQEPKGPIVLL